MKLWGGRFKKDLAESVLDFSETTQVDSRLVPYDIWGSKAHCLMLAKTGVIDVESARRILQELVRAEEAFETGELELKPELEDVHMNVETFVIEGAGAEYGGKLHSARSRNDQVMVDHKLYLREAVLELMRRLVGVVRVLLELASQHKQTPMPGFTHTQIAQPISLGFWATGYVARFLRDLQRLQECFARVNTNPLGACAFAGTSHPTDRQVTTLLLGFDEVQLHAMDCVGSRDFAEEFLADCAIVGEGLSRLSEELVWWSSPAIAMVEVDDAYATGSSIMPQKKNPCVAELVRGKTGRLYGALMQELTLNKGLPTAYNRDLQEDKPPVWEAIDTLASSLEVMAGMLATSTFKLERMRELAGEGFSTATELADYLVREHGLPFRTAHHVVGETVAKLIAVGKTFEDVEATAQLLKEAGCEVESEVLEQVLSPEGALSRHTSLGGTAPEQVGRMIVKFTGEVEGFDAFVEEKKAHIRSAKRLTDQTVQRLLAGEGVEVIPQPGLKDELAQLPDLDEYIR